MMRHNPMGDDAQAPATVAKPQAMSLHQALTSDAVSTVSGIALTYHGYRRTGSILWAIIYGFAGKMLPLVSVPVALAQGFGTKKACP